MCVAGRSGCCDGAVTAFGGCSAKNASTSNGTEATGTVERAPVEGAAAMAMHTGIAGRPTLVSKGSDDAAVAPVNVVVPRVVLTEEETP